MAEKKKKTKSVLMRIGNEGNDVTELQKMLAKTGSTIKVTGKYGIGTWSAVFRFQRNNSLSPTGFVDEKTWDKLYAMTHVVKRTTKKGAKKA